MTIEAGRCVLVVGPSGAGKDTLIAGARLRLADDERFIFPERLITRAAMPEAEAHGTISRDTFAQMMAEGRYALAWEAHGLGYVIPQEVGECIAMGQIAVCNASRRMIEDARTRFPGTHVILVEADRAVRARRLAARGRETAEEVGLRLARDVPEPSGNGGMTRLDNSGAIEEGISRFTAALLALAEPASGHRN